LFEGWSRVRDRRLGNPEALKGELSGWWSRRITGERRLVYRVQGKAGFDQRIEILMCRNL
jgi:toxin YoeB